MSTAPASTHARLHRAVLLTKARLALNEGQCFCWHSKTDITCVFVCRSWPATLGHIGSLMCDLAVASVSVCVCVLVVSTALRGRTETDWRPEERQQGGEGGQLHRQEGGREGGVDFKGDTLTRIYRVIILYLFPFHFMSDLSWAVYLGWQLLFPVADREGICAKKIWTQERWKKKPWYCTKTNPKPASPKKIKKRSHLICYQLAAW